MGSLCRCPPCAFQTPGRGFQNIFLNLKLHILLSSDARAPAPTHGPRASGLLPCGAALNPDASRARLGVGWGGPPRTPGPTQAGLPPHRNPPAPTQCWTENPPRGRGREALRSGDLSRARGGEGWGAPRGGRDDEPRVFADCGWVSAPSLSTSRPLPAPFPPLPPRSGVLQPQASGPDWA